MGAKNLTTADFVDKAARAVPVLAETSSELVSRGRGVDRGCVWGSITLERSLTCNVVAGPVAVMLRVRTRG